jgi:hypothetical protein
MKYISSRSHLLLATVFVFDKRQDNAYYQGNGIADDDRHGSYQNAVCKPQVAVHKIEEKHPP